MAHIPIKEGQMILLKHSILSLLFLLPALAHAELHIVATLPALGQIAAAVAGEDGEIRVLARVGQDPHFVPPRPTLARHLAEADLLVTAGLALESGWLPPLVELSRNSRIRQGQPGHFAGADTVEILGVMEKVDRSMGDVHPEGNPHWWMDPLWAAVAASAIAERLAKIDPAHAVGYHQRAETFGKRLQALVAEWQPRLAGISPVVSYHDSYRYFSERFAIPVLGFIEPKPGVEPSTRHLDELVRLIGTQKVSQIWVEPYHIGRIVKRVATLSGAVLVTMPDAVEGEGAEGYLSMIKLLLNAAAGNDP
jgi:zinc/manganese transport system substrate-binding protein